MDQPIKTGTKAIRLNINERNLYQYYLSHSKNDRSASCFVPLVRQKGAKLDHYLSTLKKLEELKLISVIRDADHYTGWIMTSPD